MTLNSGPARVLIFNFFGSILDRGIPLYARDIAEAMRRVGVESVELQGPRWLRSAPRPVRNCIFVFFEQVVAPIVRIVRRCSITVYPYNSAGLLDAVLDRSVVVVHDILSNRRDNRALAALYVRMTQRVHAGLGRPICAASEYTLKHLNRLRSFRTCRLSLWSNPFYSFQKSLELAPITRPVSLPPRRVLLCSGMGTNKDYAGAIRLFRKSEALREVELRIVGFGDDAALARRRIALLPKEARERITVMPRLTLEQLLSEYESSDLVWVHSRDEGFGRWIIEARLCGRPVVATKISAFQLFARLGVFLYRDTDFDEAVEAAACGRGVPAPDLAEYHATLEADVRNVLTRISHRAFQSE